MKWAVLLLLIAEAFAQEPQFNARVHEVIVPVSVMQKNGKPVAGLLMNDFLVLNDGKRQIARLVSQDVDPLPIHAVIVLQTDSGSQPALAKIKKTASIVSGYITNDMGTATPSLASVITVSDDVRIAQEFTPDPDTLGDTFAKISQVVVLPGCSMA